MKKENLEARWATYEANVQQYRVLSATVQSFILAVGAILYTQDQVPDYLLALVTILAVLHIRFIWFEVIKARHLVIDYYKHQHYSSLTEAQLVDLNEKFPEYDYIHDEKVRRHVNEVYFNKPGLKLWRLTRLKLDIIVPAGYFAIWVSLSLWRKPWEGLFL